MDAQGISQQSQLSKIDLAEASGKPQTASSSQNERNSGADAAAFEQMMTDGDARRAARAAGTSEAEIAGAARRANRDGASPSGEESDAAQPTSNLESSKEVKDIALDLVDRLQAAGSSQDAAGSLKLDEFLQSELPIDSNMPMVSDASADRVSTAADFKTKAPSAGDLHASSPGNTGIEPYREANGEQIFHVSAAFGKDKASDPNNPSAFLSPRSEWYFDGIAKGKGAQFSADFNVSKADDTTIFQIKNFNADVKDRSIPEAMLNVDGGDLTLRGRASGAGNKTLLTEDQLKDAGVMRADGSLAIRVEAATNSNVDQSTITITDLQGKELALQNLDHNRSGGKVSYRYGAYHHGGGEAVVAAANVHY